MLQDMSRVVDGILRGEFPEKLVVLDEQVKVVNEAAHLVAKNRPGGDSQRDEANALILWLAGLNPDIFVYGAQLMIKHHGVHFSYDEKTIARMDTIEDKFLRSTPYRATTYSEIEHFAWPQKFLDDSTFEERLANLADEFEPEESPVDMLLSGMAVPEDLDFTQRFALAVACVDDLRTTFNRYGKPTIVTDERFNRFLNWLLTIEDDIALYAVRLLMGGGQFTFKAGSAEGYREFADRFGEIADKV